MVTRVVHDEGDFGVEVVLASEFEVDHFFPAMVKKTG